MQSQSPPVLWQRPETELKRPPAAAEAAIQAILDFVGSELLDIVLAEVKILRLVLVFGSALKKKWTANQRQLWVLQACHQNRLDEDIEGTRLEKLFYYNGSYKAIAAVLCATDNDKNLFADLDELQDNDVRRLARLIQDLDMDDSILHTINTLTSPRRRIDDKNVRFPRRNRAKCTPQQKGADQPPVQPQHSEENIELAQLVGGDEAPSPKRRRPSPSGAQWNHPNGGPAQVPDIRYSHSQTSNIGDLADEDQKACNSQSGAHESNTYVPPLDHSSWPPSKASPQKGQPGEMNPDNLILQTLAGFETVEEVLQTKAQLCYSQHIESPMAAQQDKQLNLNNTHDQLTNLAMLDTSDSSNVFLGQMGTSDIAESPQFWFNTSNIKPTDMQFYFNNDPSILQDQKKDMLFEFDYESNMPQGRAKDMQFHFWPNNHELEHLDVYSSQLVVPVQPH